MPITLESIQEKIPILTKFFQMYGYGNFDLSHEEMAKIIHILVAFDREELELQMRNIYERLEKLRMG